MELIPAPFDDPEEARGVATHVICERGQWVVYLDVLFAQELRRFRIGAYRTERLAAITAAQIRRYAGRDLPTE